MLPQFSAPIFQPALYVWRRALSDIFELRYRCIPEEIFGNSYLPMIIPRRILFSATFASVFFSTPASAAEYRGTGIPATGDSFYLKIGSGELRVRLCGIEAPPLPERGGVEAYQALRRITEMKAIRCIPLGGGTPCDMRIRPTSGNVVIAQCFIVVPGIDKDIAEELVRTKLACDLPQVSGGYYRRKVPDACVK